MNINERCFGHEPAMSELNAMREKIKRLEGLLQEAVPHLEDRPMSMCVRSRSRLIAAIRHTLGGVWVQAAPAHFNGQTDGRAGDCR